MRQNMNFLIKKSKEQYYKATSKVNFHRVNVLMKREKKKIALASGSLIAIIIVSVIVFENASSKVNIPKSKISVSVPTNNFSESLEDITKKLANLEEKLSSDGAVVNVQSIQSDIKSIQKKSEQLSEGSNEFIKAQIKKSNEELSAKIDGLSKELASLKAEKKQTKFLNVEDLPYQVISVDNIQQQNIVTVSYDNSVFPMDIGDYLASWKLISADFVSQKAEFVNKKNQHIVVDLNRITKGNANG